MLHVCPRKPEAAGRLTAFAYADLLLLPLRKSIGKIPSVVLEADLLDLRKWNGEIVNLRAGG
jgi:hypothetical protein